MPSEAARRAVTEARLLAPRPKAIATSNVVDAPGASVTGTADSMMRRSPPVLGVVPDPGLTSLHGIPVTGSPGKVERTTSPCVCW